MRIRKILRALLPTISRNEPVQTNPTGRNVSGTILSGRYKLVELLEQDKDIQFYRARHVAINKEFVLRLLPREKMTPTIQQTFTAQALQWSSSKTDRGLQLADYGECEEGMYIVEAAPDNGDTL